MCVMRCATLNGTHLLSPLGEKCTLDYSIHLKLWLLISLKTHMQMRSDFCFIIALEGIVIKTELNLSSEEHKKRCFQLCLWWIFHKVKMTDTVKLEILKSITQLVYISPCTHLYHMYIQMWHVLCQFWYQCYHALVKYKCMNVHL